MRPLVNQRQTGVRLLSLSAISLMVILLLAGTPVTLAQPIRIIFLHHSCGHNLIEEGGVRGGLTQRGYAFYDHGYNGDGLRLADGTYTGTNYAVPGDNTDPDGMAEIFTQPLHDPPDNTFSHLMTYDVIAFKSCFPTSNIGSDDQLDEIKSYYLTMRDRMDQYPNKLFVIVTQPPQVPGSSDPAEAARARALADWLGSDTFLAGHPNVVTFDFFNLLAGSDNFLRPEYRYDDYDAHPNGTANGQIGPLLVDFLDQAIAGFEFGDRSPAPDTTPPPADQPPEEPSDQPPPAAPPPNAGGTIHDFEGQSHWELSTDQATLDCGAMAGTAHGGSSALLMTFDVHAGGWADCIHNFQEPQDWSSGAGMALWSHSEDARGTWVTLMLFSGDPLAATPFHLSFQLTERSGSGWEPFSFPWTAFEQAEWADETGLTAVDPTRILGYGFSVGEGQGTLWIDDVTLVGGDGGPPPAEPPEEPPVEPPPAADGEDGPATGFCSGLAAFSLLPLAAVALRGIIRVL